MSDMHPTTSFAAQENGSGDQSKQPLPNGNDQNPSPSVMQATVDLANSKEHGNKQLKDVKFAMSVVASGAMSEPELVSSLAEWTAYGNQSLADHLVSIGKINQQDVETLEQYSSEAETSRTQVNSFSEGGSATGGSEKGFGPSDANDSSIEVESQKSSGTSARDAEQDAPFVSLEMSHFARTIGLGEFEQKADVQVRRVSAEYRLVRKLGQGGLGSVWLARDEVLDRSVAIKELKEENSSQSTVERFRREARLTGQLDHPNIVTVHQFGADEATGKAFYAMRFVGKKTLGDAITEYHDQLEAGQDGTGQLNQILNAFQMVCQAIAFAHSRGVIHRDLKPENIALDNFGQVSVIDWGLAKSFNEPEHFDAAQGNSGDSLSLSEQTFAGQVVGTPIYMSPEQAAGRIDEIDERTDVYGLGAILFHILAGKAPHLPGDHRSGDSNRIESILDSIMKNPSPSVQEIRADAPAELSAICNRAMARKKSRRFASATELADAVKQWIDGIADRTRRFELLKSQAREIELRVTETATAVSRDARFASSLPPIQGIIDTIDQSEEGGELEQWRGRLESIFSAMLRTNQNLHSLSFTRVTEQEITELTRVQRNAGDNAFIHVVPSSRLARFERTGCFDCLLMLDPGDVDYTIRPSDSQKRRAASAINRLAAWTPIFDERSGHLFGLVAIEVDLEKVISDYLVSLENVSNSIYVFDADDHLWVSRHERSQCSASQRTKEYLLEMNPEISVLFDGTREALELESKLVARRFKFGQAGLGFDLYALCVV